MINAAFAGPAINRMRKVGSITQRFEHISFLRMAYSYAIRILCVKDIQVSKQINKGIKLIIGHLQ